MSSVGMNEITGRIDFNAAEIENFITQRGYRVSWEKWAPCPCVREQSFKPDIACPLCKGYGDVFSDLIETRALVTSIGAQKEFRDFSEWYVGAASITVSVKERTAGYRDRFILLDCEVVFSELRKREEDSSTKTYLTYAPVEMRRVFVRADDKSGYVELTEGTHYTIANDGAVVWVMPALPAVGQVVSFNYTYRPSYQVIELLNDVRLTRTHMVEWESIVLERLPQKLLTKRSHLMYQLQQQNTEG